MPIANVTYSPSERDTIISALIDLMVDPLTPSNHVVFLTFNLSTTWGYDVGTFLGTEDARDYATKEVLFITGPSDSPLLDFERDFLHERLLVAFDELIQFYEDIVSS